MKQFYIISKTSVVLLVVTFILLLAGCKSKKLSVLDTSGGLKSKTHEQVLDDVLAHELDYNTITTKGKVSLNGKEITTVFKLVKDEIIQASIRPMLGIEAVRMDVTPDKVVLIDRLGGKYATVDLNESGVSGLVAFNFYNLQALLTNKLFLAGNTKVDKASYTDFKVSVANNNFILDTEDSNKLHYTFAVDPSDRIVSTAIRQPAKDIALVWGYSNFVEDGRDIYPTTMNGNIKIKKKNIKVGVTYSNLDVNTEFNIDTSIPKKYKKIELLELLDAYMKIK